MTATIQYYERKIQNIAILDCIFAEVLKSRKSTDNGWNYKEKLL
jgi:hypothetical protein